MMLDAYASQPHYWDHIAPIFEQRGRDFYIYPATVDRPGIPTRALRASDHPIMVAGYPDLKRIRRPAVFIEHGAGENYNLADPHYSGGSHRDRVVLFLCPNERVAEANSIYPAPSVVVGSPRVEWLATASDKGWRGSRGDGRLRVVVSFHWNCGVHPQAGTALFEYQPYFEEWARDPRIELRGHAHPKIAIRARRMYPFPFIDDFAEVVKWADVYAVDNSSTLFEAVACGLDVVVLDSVHYTSEETGWRFWKYADIGPRISPGGDLVEAALTAVAERVGYDDIRRHAVAEIFGTLEGATERAVKAIDDHFGTTGGASAPTGRTRNTQPSNLG